MDNFINVDALVERVAARLRESAPAAIEPQWLDSKHAAIYLSVSLSTLEVWRRNGQGPSFVRRGRLIRYSRTALDEYMNGERF